VARKPLPSIAIVSESAAFTEQVRGWPHPSFRIEQIKSSKNPEIICFGPDVTLSTAEHWMKKHAKAKWVWVKQRWTANEMADLGSQFFPGYFIDLSDESTIHRTWCKVLQTNSSSKLELKEASFRLESLINFIQSVANADNIYQLLSRLRDEMKAFEVVGDPVLLLEKSHGHSQLYYFRGRETYLRSLPEVPRGGHRVRIHDANDRQFLANQMGRPFGKIIAFPIAQERSSGWQINPVIFFEHRMEDADLPQFIDSVAQRLQAVSLALDRLVLEIELKRASQLWEKTFDGIEEPIAILDLDGEIVRSNRHFVERGLTGLERGLIKNGERLFQVENYDIRIKGMGPVLSSVVDYQDVTKAMMLRERVVQVEKMSAIGHLAGHIAHELNNPLTGIRSFAQILMKQLEERSQFFNDLREVEDAARRCQEIILNLLEFSKGNLDSQTHLCDLNDIVNRTLPFLKSAMGRHESVIEIHGKPLPVEVEPQLMQQVVFNLVNNACQAMGEKNGRIEVSTSETTRKNICYAVLSIRDSGPGIPKELQSLIFEPFFTTKKEGQGTGLGLSFSREFVRKLGGDIICDPQVERGALFHVLLPMAKAGVKAS
jgi:signal transduction histidine kinase